MNFVNKINLTVVLSEFVLCVNKDKTLLCSDFLTTSKELTSVVFHHFVVFLRNDTLSNDFLLRDVEVMTFVSLSSWSDNWFWETLVLTHSVRKFNTADFTTTILVVSPSRTSKDATDNHFYAETFTLNTNCNLRVWASKFPVRADVSCCIEELSSNLVEYLSLERNTLRKYNVESRDTVACNHNHDVVVDEITVASLTAINSCLAREVVVCTN